MTDTDNGRPRDEQTSNTLLWIVLAAGAVLIAAVVLWPEADDAGASAGAPPPDTAGPLAIGPDAKDASSREPPARTDDAGIDVAFDRKTGTATIRVPARDGEASWADVLRGLARMKGFDDAALAGAIPDKTFRLDKMSTQLMLMATNALLEPSLRVRVVTDAKSDRRVLEITVDRKALLAGKRRLKTMLRAAVTRIGESKTKFGLTLDDGWDKAPAGRNVVIFVHGLQSAPEPFAGFLAEVRDAGLPTGWVRLPNDQPVAESAGLLADELNRLRKQAPQRGVALVATSMGGLICREAIEDPKLAPANVRQLIMVGTPNHGSRLAEFGFALELWQYAQATRAKRSALQATYEAIEDGLGEANDDLTPGSAFLKRLNARKRNGDVSYSLLLGTGGMLSDADLAAVRAGLARAGKANRFVRFLGPRLDKALADMDEVVAGKGDGAVSLARGRLEGVADTVVLPFIHTEMLHKGKTAEQKALRRQVIKRLLSPPKR